MKITIAAANAIARAYKEPKANCKHCYGLGKIKTCEMGDKCQCPYGVVCHLVEYIKCECVK